MTTDRTNPSDWKPEVGEMVLTTPLEDRFTHLSRMEVVEKVTKKRVITISGRVFCTPDFRSDDRTTLKNDCELVLLQLTPGRKDAFNLYRVHQKQLIVLESTNWSSLPPETVHKVWSALDQAKFPDNPVVPEPRTTHRRFDFHDRTPATPGHISHVMLRPDDTVYGVCVNDVHCPFKKDLFNTLLTLGYLKESVPQSEPLTVS